MSNNNDSDFIWVDASSAVLQRAGVGRYTRELIRSLWDTGSPAELNRLGLFSCGSSKASPDLPAANFRTSRLPARAWRGALLAGHLSRRTVVPGLDQFRLFHATDLAFPWALSQQVLVTVHDLSVLRYPKFHTALNRIFQTIMLNLLRRRDHEIIAMSQFTAKELEHLLGISPARINVIYPGVAPIFGERPTPDEIRAVCSKYGLKRPFVLSVATNEPRKNLNYLLRAFGKLTSGSVQLVLAGRDGWGVKGKAKATSTSSENIRWLGFVPDDELRCLYREAAVFAYPSFYEGFGSPVAEAMVCGAAVVCSARCGIAEVAGDTIRIVEPSDLNGLVKALGDLLEMDTEALRASAQAKASDLSYTTTAQNTWALYRTLCAR